jgi:hypothetical protein
MASEVFWLQDRLEFVEVSLEKILPPEARRDEPWKFHDFCHVVIMKFDTKNWGKPDLFIEFY